MKYYVIMVYNIGIYAKHLGYIDGKCYQVYMDPMGYEEACENKQWR